MNIIPIICPICDHKMQFQHRNLEPHEGEDEAHPFLSVFCPQNIRDAYARDSHALFNYSLEWQPLHRHVHINNFKFSHDDDKRIYISNLNALNAYPKTNSIIYETYEPININWISKESITLLIQTLLTFQ